MVSALTVVWLLGCGDTERPTPIDLGSGAQGGSAQGGSAQGGSAQGGSAQGGSGATSGSGGASGSAGTGGSGGITPTQVFDPAEVYVEGRLDGADCNTWVVASVTSPAEIEGGFACEHDKLLIRPTDGALLYAQGAELLLWEPDRVASGYPPDPGTNDIPLAAPSACSVSQVWFQAETSIAYFGCGSAQEVEGPEGSLDLGGDELLSVGIGAVLLTGTGNQLRLRTGSTVTPVEAGSLEIEVSASLRVRAIAEGFILLKAPLGARPEGALLVSLDGSLVSLGNYPAATGVSSLSSCELEANGAAVCLATLGTGLGLVRFSTSQASGELLYREDENSPLKLTAARLFTGP